MALHDLIQSGVNEIKFLEKFEELKKELLKTKTTKKGKEDIELSIQLLVMKYTGLLETLPLKENKTKQALLLEVIFNSGHANIQKKLSYMSIVSPERDIYLEKYLIFIITLFEDLKLQEPLTLAKKDLKTIQSINKRK